MELNDGTQVQSRACEEQNISEMDGKNFDT